MSFNFEWPTFSEAFYADAREMLAQALNKGEKPPIIADRIEVKELNMGTVPPELEILEIGDLSTDRFRGIFRLTYAGDAYIVLQTKVQANPLNVPRPSLDILDSPRILFAAAPLVVPMTLRLSSLSLRAIVVLVVSRQKGITLVFKNDPLESVNVSSSFDGVESVAGFIQREIEGQLREAFRSDLPGVIHRLSQKWLSGEVKSATADSKQGGAGGRKKGGGLNSSRSGFDKDAKIETRTAYVPEGPEGRIPNSRARGRGLTTRIHRNEDELSFAGESETLASEMGGSSVAGGSHYVHDRASHRGGPASAPRSSRRYSSTSSMMRPSALVREDTLQSVPESIESYDPTYGLRPDALPLHLGFTEYERLVRTAAGGRGLGDVLETSSDDEGDERYQNHEADGSFDMIELKDLVDDGHHPPVPRWDHSSAYQRGIGSPSLPSHRQRYSFDSMGPALDSDYDADRSLETIPAVGGGTITRPRVFHTQSQMRTRTVSNGSLSAHGSPSTTATTVRGMPTDDEDDLRSGASTLGPLRKSGMAPPEFKSLASLDGRQDYFNAVNSSRYQSFSSIGGSGPSLLNRSNSRRGPPPSASYNNRSSRAAFSSSGSTSPENTRRSFPSTLASHYSSPPSSIAHEEEEEADSSADAVDIAFSPSARPTTIDLLSRSPSSILNSMEDRAEANGPITLSATGNESCAHLATLTNSNQTLSPFTRSHEHFAARSTPHVVNRLAGGALSGIGAGLRSPALGGGGFGGLSASRGGSGTAGDETPAPVKATRKRVHRIGSAKPPKADDLASSVTSAGGASESGSRAPSQRRGMGERSSSGGTTSAQAYLDRSEGLSELSDYFPNTVLEKARMARVAKRMSGMGVGVNAGRG